jgi:hypothetical protein
MSDFKSLRLKKNAELQNAMSSVRKDLYDWKQAATVLKLNRESSSAGLTGRSAQSHAHAPPQAPPKLKSLDASRLTKRTSSLKDLVKPSIVSESTSSITSVSVASASSKNLSSMPSPRTRVKPLDSQYYAKHSLDFSDWNEEFFNAPVAESNLSLNKKSEFLNTFKEKRPSSALKPPQIPLPPSSSDENTRVYLTSARSVTSSMNRNPSQIEEQLVNYVFFLLFI